MSGNTAARLTDCAHVAASSRLSQMALVASPVAFLALATNISDAVTASPISHGNFLLRRGSDNIIQLYIKKINPNPACRQAGFVKTDFFI